MLDPVPAPPIGGEGAEALPPTAENGADVIAEVHALSEAGRYGEALALVSGELSRHPADGELLFARASVWFDWGRVREAYSGFLRAKAAGLDRTSLYLNLAWSCQLLGLEDTAEPFARKAIELDADHVAAHFGLGTILQRRKKYEEAIASFVRTLEISSDHAQAVGAIARCKLELKDYASAEEWMRRAVDLAPENPQFWNNLGVAMANQGRYLESLEALKQAADLEVSQGALPLSMIDTGFALVTTGQYEVAMDLFRKNLPVLPDPRAHGYYAFLLLNQGHLRKGWTQYEFRWMQEPHLSKRPAFSQPPWGGQDLTGKTILVMVEQGAGDVIHFARYIAVLKAMGATVLLQVRQELAQLAAAFHGVDVVFAPPGLPPPFDYHIAMMGIPHVLGTELATIPADVPYVRIDPVKAKIWSGRISGSGLKAGVAWAGNPKYPRDNFRSIALAKLDRLWDVRGVDFFSLQTPLKEGELESFPVRATLINLGPELTDFSETAAAIAQLDLVICVDTAVAHLAGALGKPVWVLLPEIGDFRWLEGREDSPWYPTMRLFRQRVLGEWDEVVARVEAALREAVKTGLTRLPDAATRTSAPAAKFAPDIGAALLERTLSPEAEQIARVAETRHGIIQYLPDARAPAQSIAWYGEYLQPQLDLLSRLVPSGAHVIEAGSGVGEHALALAKMVGASGHVIAYESHPVARLCLRQNLEANRAGGIVTLMRRDLAGRQQKFDADRDPDSGGIHTRLSAIAREPVDTVDDLLLDRLDLLKIRSIAIAADILHGASKTLWRLRPLVFIDAPNAEGAVQLAERMQEFGYRSWRMETALFSPSNFNLRDTDIFHGETALAVLAIPEEVEPAAALDGCAEVAPAADLPPGSSKSPTPPESAARIKLVETASAESGPLRWFRKLLR